MVCGSYHPDLNGVRCIAPSMTHADHIAVHGSIPIFWVNEDFVAPGPKLKSKGAIVDFINEAAGNVPPPQRRGTSARPPIVATDDPWSSHVAASRIEPVRGTRKAAVLVALREARGGWVDGSSIATAEVGGSEGLRRLRELREADGWPIERRPSPSSATSWQYRLAGPGENL